MAPFGGGKGLDEQLPGCLQLPEFAGEGPSFLGSGF